MKKLNLCGFFVAIAAIAMALLTGCNSKEATLLSSVPVDKPCVVASLNLHRLVDDAQINVADGVVTIPPYIENSALLSALIPGGDPQKAMELISEFAENINDNFMVAYSDKDGNSFLTFEIENSKGYDDWAENRLDYSTFQKIDGVEFVETRSESGVWLAKRGRFGWITRGEPARLVEVLKRADKASAAELNGIRDFFTEDDCINFAIMTEPDNDSKGQKSVWMMGDINFEGNRSYGEMKEIHGDGSPFEREYVAAISNDFLRYVPDSMTVVAALGRSDEPIEFDKIPEYNLIKNGLGNNVFILELVKPYLAAIDGTVAVALKVDLTSGSPSLKGGVVVAHMSQAMVNKTVGQLRELAAQSGVPVEVDKKTGRFKADLSMLAGMPLTLNCGNVDGYLMLSTYSLDGTFNNSYAPYFNGRECACLVQVPSMSFISPDFAYGFKFVSETQSGSSEYRAEFTNSSKPYLESAITLLNQLATTAPANNDNFWDED